MTSYLNPYAPIHIHGTALPHWQQENVRIFVTWRLSDSLPAGRLKALKSERDNWIATHPEPLTDSETEEFHQRFSHQVDQWLDQGIGACILKDRELRVIVADSIQHFDGHRYLLDHFVVMPNHVHVLFQLNTESKLEDILHSWKSYTAKRITKFRPKLTTVWQAGYWDRLIRSPQHLERCRSYIRDNPVKAKLPPNTYTLFEKKDEQPRVPNQGETP